MNRFNPRIRRSESSDIDEIPLAVRRVPFRDKIFTSRRSTFLFIIFLGFVSLILLFDINKKPDKANSIASKSSIDSSEKLLLGHFPYPEASSEDLISYYPGMQLHKDTYNAFIQMKSAAAKEGIDLILISGFRSIDLQRQIFYRNKSFRNQIALERAKVSAPPGYSEHSTGYAIDIGDATMRETDFEESFESTPSFRWLKNNAAKYHFILSFPKGNSQGVSYEPWHWRFEGTVDALKLFESANRRRRRDEIEN